MAAALNAGESTQDQLSDAKMLRMKLLKMAEIVDAMSKKIATLEVEGAEVEGSPDFGLVKTLKSRIRNSAINFVKDTLVGLPSVPTEEELVKLKENRKKEAEKKIAEEKTKAQEAKIRFEQQQQQQAQHQVNFITSVFLCVFSVNLVCDEELIVLQAFASFCFRIRCWV